MTQIAFDRQVQTYYDRNSAWFRLVGRRRRNPAIHRPVWAEGVADRQAALHYVHERISRHAQELLARQSDAPLRLLDLGCGHGATVAYLAAKHGSQVSATGLTISAAQAHTGKRWAHAEQPPGLCAFVQADFHAVPLARAIDLAWSIEAFAHAHAPERYFAEAGRVLKPGGRLVLCDDFRVEQDGAPIDDTDRRWLRIFQDGWRIPHLLTTTQAIAPAQSNGLQLVEQQDFSPYLRLRPCARRWIPLFERLLRMPGSVAPLLGSLIGGWALEQAIRRGLVAYRFLVFAKLG